MSYYHLDLDELSAYSGVSVEELKNRSYTQLETEIKAMKKDKILKQNNRNAGDKEYERIVLKFFQPVPYLQHWFTDKEIVLACALTGLTERNICSEMFVEPGRKMTRERYEYLRTSIEYVKQYDRHGRELAQRVRKQMDVYRVVNHYQTVCHGKVILHLLYERYPELRKFEFEAYGMSYGSDYEIYPKNGIYVPFTALMTGNIDQILFRNREYCKSYNNGRYSPEECEKAFHTDEALEMFDIIRKVGEQEHILGHSSVTIGKTGAVTADGLVEKDCSGTVPPNVELGIKLMKKCNRTEKSQKEMFYLHLTKSYDVHTLITDFLKLIGCGPSLHVHICDIRDHLGDYALDISLLDATWINNLIPGMFYENGRYYHKYAVVDTFGWDCGYTYDLTIRIDCPEMGR